LKNDFLIFKVGGYTMQVRCANVQAIDDKFSQDLTHKNH